MVPARLENKSSTSTIKSVQVRFARLPNQAQIKICR